MNDINVILADRAGLGSVRLCECDSIHLTIGPVTLHLETKTFAETTRMMHKAMEQLTKIMNEEQAAPNPPHPHEGNLSRVTH